jgi:hypothetical protein
VLCFALLCFVVVLCFALLCISNQNSSQCWRGQNCIGPVLCLNHTYALSGADISVLSINRQSGLNLPLWIFVFQFAHTVDHSVPWPVPFRNASGRMRMGRTTRAGAWLHVYFIICLPHFISMGSARFSAPTKQHPRSSSRPRRHPREQQEATDERRSAAPSSSSSIANISRLVFSS